MSFLLPGWIWLCRFTYEERQLIKLAWPCASLWLVVEVTPLVGTWMFKNITKMQPFKRDVCASEICLPASCKLDHFPIDLCSNISCVGVF